MTEGKNPKRWEGGKGKKNKNKQNKKTPKKNPTHTHGRASLTLPLALQHHLLIRAGAHCRVCVAVLGKGVSE